MPLEIRDTHFFKPPNFFRCFEKMVKTYYKTKFAFVLARPTANVYS